MTHVIITLKKTIVNTFYILSCISIYPKDCGSVNNAESKFLIIRQTTAKTGEIASLQNFNFAITKVKFHSINLLHLQIIVLPTI